MSVLAARVREAAAGVSAAWSPLALSPALWLDASDTASIAESGGAVSQWSDKSTHDRHATQSSAGAKPTTGSTTMNGKNVLSFDGGDTLNSDMSASPTVATYFIVNQPTTTSADRVMMGSSGGSGIAIRHGGNNRLQIMASASQLLYQSTWDQGTSAGVVTVKFADNNNGNSASLYLNGGTPDTDAVHERVFTAGRTTTIGSDRGGECFAGYIAEILVFDSILTDVDRLVVEAYLKAKWGTP